MTAKTGQLHGRDHRAGGVDPIPGLSNLIHWGENTDTDEDGLTLTTTQEIELEPGLFIVTSGTYILLDAATTITLDAADEINLTPGDNLVVTLGTGKSLEVKNHLAATIFRIDEDGNVYMKTGATITANL